MDRLNCARFPIPRPATLRTVETVNERGNTKQMKVCIVSWYAYGLIDPNWPHFGGSELRSFTFARGLARQVGWDVQFIVADAGQPAHQIVEGLAVRTAKGPRYETPRLMRAYQNVVNCVERSRSFPWLRIKKWDSRLAWQLPVIAVARLLGNCPWEKRVSCAGAYEIAHSGADIVCCFCVTYYTSLTIDACRRKKVKTVLFIADDVDLSAEFYAGSRYVDQSGIRHGDLCHRAITQADAIVVQTVKQQELLAERFGRKGKLIRNPINLHAGMVNESETPRQHVLWIGRSDQQKRPNLCLELARRCPEIPFVMIMNKCDKIAHRQLIAEAPSNVQVIERVPFHEIDRMFSNAAVLISTSLHEGFPNTFLQACKHRVPILSLEVDPDGVLTRTGCGRQCAGNLDQLTAELKSLWEDPVRAAAMGRAGRAYAEAEHDLNGRVDELAEFLMDVSAGRSNQPSGSHLKD